MPVYNAEKCLEDSIQSILCQTEKEFELILVDDGSTDQSLAICRNFEKVDCRIIVIHKENGGVSSARNTGLMRATGKYIVFVDSDDLVVPDLLKMMENSTAELVMVGFDDYDPDRNITASFKEKAEKYEIKNDDNINHFINSDYSSFVWGKRYKRELLRNKIFFDEAHRFSEDILFNNAYILSAKDVEVIDNIGYHHCHYTFDTVGSVAWKYPLIQRIPWQEEAYYQFTKYPKVQERYGKMFLFLCEKEIISIAKSDDQYKVKKKRIQELVSHAFFKNCIDIYSQYLTSEMLFYIKHKLYFMLISRYH